MRAFTSLESRAAALPIDNIDTDRIIPARFLTTTSKEGLGQHLFADWPRGQRANDGAEILVTGHNFGCGSSREHAVWALVDAGVRAVISTGFADIFHANALRNGLVPVVLDSGLHSMLLEQIETDPLTRVRVDLERQELRSGSLESTFVFDDFARHCITNGLDELEYLLRQTSEIDAFEHRRPSPVDTTGGRQ